MFLLSSRVLVLLQFLLSASLVLAARPKSFDVAEVALCLTGMTIGLWAMTTIGLRRVSVMPELRDDAQLTTTGPYRFIRHPMYTALWLACFGLALSPFATWKLIVLILLAMVLATKAAREEQLLHNRFPSYQSYRNMTKRFVPLIW